MISGTSQADTAILIVPANEGAFITTLMNYHDGYNGYFIQGTTRKHVRICHVFGIKQIIVCINKMDHSSVDWSQER